MTPGGHELECQKQNKSGGANTDMPLPEGYRMTELGLLPEEWRVVRLGDVVSLRRGTIHPSNKPQARYVGLEHLVPGEIRIKQFGHACTTRSAKAIFKPGDILYGKLRPYLDKAALADWSGVCSTDILVLQPSEYLTSLFLAYQMHTRFVLEHAKATTTGVNHPRTSWKAMTSVIIPLPPLPEQQAIAHVLRTVQESKEATKRVIAAARELKKSLMRHLFTYGPVPVDQVHQVEMQETEIGSIPAHWRVVKLGEALKGTQYGLNERAGTSGKYPILRMNNLINGYIDISNLKYVDLDYTVFERFRLMKGDLLFNRTNSYDLVGKTSLFGLEGKYVFASYLIRLVVNNKYSVPEFLNYYLNRERTQDRLRMLASRGVSQANISATKLKGFDIPLPPLPEQHEIARILQMVDRKIEAEEAKRKALEEVFRSLLNELMTARRRLPAQFVALFEEKAEVES